jgi:hypothetical protein
LAIIVSVAFESICLDAQAAQWSSQTDVSINKSENISLSISLPKDHIPVGQTPWVFLTVKNLGNAEISFPIDRVRVEGEKGEAPTTLRQRQLTHRLRPGEEVLRPGGYEPSIEPGGSSIRKYDLSELYDLSKPGKYTVYIEALDWAMSKSHAVWVRSPVAVFEIVPIQ